MYMIFGFCYKMWDIPTGALKKKKSQYMVSYPELGSDPPIGSDRESVCDRFVPTLTHPHPLLGAGVSATPQKSPAVTSND